MKLTGGWGVAEDQMSSVMNSLRRAVLAGCQADLTDGQLLENYLSRRDEAAVAALVRRHGPMVWGVCRRIARNHHDAEDAFQATFLVLVRKAASVRPREMVGNWLYGVARRTALKARATAAKRQARERQVQQMPEPATVPEPAPGHDLEALLDQELSRLPDKYRAAIVLCDLGGKTRKEVARQLQMPEGTFSTRLRTARAMLAKRLARHGLAVSGGALAALSRQATAGVPASVLFATIKAASLLAAGQAAATAAISANVAGLTQEVLKTMFVTKLRFAAVVVLAASLIGLGTTAAAYRALASDRGVATDAAAKAVADNGQKEAGDGERPRAGAAERGNQSGEPASKSLPAAGTSDPFDEKPQAGNDPRQGKQEPADGRAGDNSRLRGLLKDRLAAVQKLAERVEQLSGQGGASLGEVRQAYLRVYRAELDLCETTKERIAVLEKIAKVYEEMEGHANALARQGSASPESVLEAKVNRLEAEIAVEREKAKLATPPK
jgi:RNA polymerase sigma factor (sigma-70 family)